MIVEEIQNLLDKYLDWLRDKTTLRQLDDWVEITTPYIDRHNDYLQIYATRKNGNYILTDDGYILQDLEQSGCAIESPKRQDLLKMTLNGFGVQLQGKKLEIHASAENFSLKKHNLVQAMLAINDLFYLAVPMVASIFFEDVVQWLELNEIRYTPKVKFTGKTGYDHLFDFVIPKSRKKPERIIQTITRPNRDTAMGVAFAWVDTREVRPSDSKAYAFLNDTEHTVQAGVLDALRSYDVSPIVWSKREELREEFSA
ncbi:MAG: hypothetical protein C0417_11635 [Chlorobiaceae bacterium]|nr:hypothetical protein [Chlorobiaceae bacterium]